MSTTTTRVSLLTLALALAGAGCAVAPLDEESSSDEDGLSGVAMVEGNYVFKTQVSGKCLDIYAASTSNGAAVQEYDCNGSAAQVFHIGSAGGGVYTISNPHSGKLLSVANASTNPGVELIQWDYQNIDTQKFKFLDLGNGQYSVRIARTDFALDVRSASPANGTPVQQYPWNGTAAQRWTLTAVGGNPPPPPGGGPSTGSAQVFVHYMPWFASKPFSGQWGWHWTMNSRNPDAIVNGKRDIASHYYPSVGPYDSGDPDLVEYHVLLMKYAGIKGAIADWYGMDNYLDYGAVHHNTGMLFDALKKAGLSLILCYEDQSIKHMVEGGVVSAGNAVAKGQGVMNWLDQNWFKDASYVHENGKPLLLDFGPQYFSTAQWNQVFSGTQTQPSFVTLDQTVSPANGFFFWPMPQAGEAGDRQSLLNLLPQTKIPAAYPRFDDFYAQAGVGPSYGYINDRGGAQFAETLSLAFGAHPAFIQLATWNDWGEGTGIEPTAQYGVRDLQKTQDLVRANGWAGLPWSAADLQLPITLYNARKAGKNKASLDAAAAALYAGNPASAKSILAQL
jgi:ricin-type beta-trefoil lectin protein/glycosyl hydrolase family 99